MKKALFAFALVLLLVVSCTSTKAVSSQKNAPQASEIVITSEKGLPFGEDLQADGYWRQVVCSAQMEEQARALAGERNLVVLAEDDMVISAVSHGQFLVGILPLDAEIPQGCVKEVAIK